MALGSVSQPAALPARSRAPGLAELAIQHFITLSHKGSNETLDRQRRDYGPIRFLPRLKCPTGGVLKTTAAAGGCVTNIAHRNTGRNLKSNVQRHNVK